jgi:hypothetical protein
MAFIIPLNDMVRNELCKMGKRVGGEKGKEWIQISESSSEKVRFAVITDVCSTVFGREKLEEGSEWMKMILGGVRIETPAPEVLNLI